MKDLLPDPPRWRDGIHPSGHAERAAGAVARDLSSLPPLSARQLVRIKARLAPGSGQRWPFRFWVTVTAALLLGGATAASAARLKLLPGWLTDDRPPEAFPQSPPVRPPRGRTRRPATPSVAPTNPLPSERPWEPTATMPQETKGAAPVWAAPSMARAADTAPVRLSPSAPLKPRQPQAIARDIKPGHTDVASERPPRPPGPAEQVGPMSTFGAAPASPGSLLPSVTAPVGHSVDLEAESRPFHPPTRALPSPGSASAAEGTAKPLVDAIRALRADHAPARALALLEAHQAEVSRGSFNHEALLVRVEALLALHREPEALRLLDATTLADVAAWRSLRLTRAELRASAGRCTDALEDFDLVLVGTVDERALRGRDLCRKKLAAQTNPRP